MIVKKVFVYELHSVRGIDDIILALSEEIKNGYSVRSITPVFPAPSQTYQTFEIILTKR